MSAIKEIRDYRRAQLSKGKVPTSLTLCRGKVAEIVRELRSQRKDRSDASPRINLKSGNISLFGIWLLWPDK